MKRLVLSLMCVVALAGIARPAFADGCYICSGGDGYVKYTGEDNQDKRKAAKACGCQVSGTRGDCSAANLKIMCTVENEKDESVKLAQCTETNEKKN